MLQKLLIVGLAVTFATAEHKEGDDPLDWLRDSIPGEPGVDYPIFSAVEQTQFDCDGKVFGGYYADPEMGCQAYHVCLLDPLSGSMYPTSFLCPNGTLFQQQIFNCDWWYNVDCAQAEGLYGLAEAAFGDPEGGNGDGGGNCPAANPLSDAECAGSVSNCWSPGQPDTDCPNYGLCCFDGCADTCVDSQVASDSKPEYVQTTPAQEDYIAPAPQTTPLPIVSSTGYNYPVPDVTLPVRPVTEAYSPPITQPPTLYGAPPPASRSGRQGRRRGRNGRRRGRRLGRKVLRKRRL